MRHFAGVWLTLCILVAGCQQSKQPSAPPDRDGSSTTAEKKIAAAAEVTATPEAGDGQFVVGRPVRHENLAIFPVASKVARNDDRFITLDEGLREGTIQVLEVGAVAGEGAPSQRDRDSETATEHVDDSISAGGELQAQLRRLGQSSTQRLEVEGDVNRLMVINSSGKSLYLMPGEIIIGGKQDRCIARETIVPPGDKPVAIDAFCVEHGRWSGRQALETASIISQTADFALSEEEVADLSAAAGEGKFVASAGSLSKDSRLAVQARKGQQKVWEEVAGANAAMGVDYESGTFAANYCLDEAVERLAPYLENLQERVASRKRAVGVIVAINGKVEAADVFESTPLFRKLWPKLLKSYALDAASGAGQGKAEANCTIADAKRFLDQAMQAGVEKTEHHEGLVLTTRSSEEMTSFAAGDEDAADEPAEFGGGGLGGGAGGFGGGVHSAAFAR